MRLKRLEQFRIGGSRHRMELGIPLPTTPDGRVYRYSPNEDAHPRHFLLGERVEGFLLPETQTPRMSHLPGTPGTVCPYSGIKDEDAAFIHPDDVAAAKAVVAHAFHADASDAFHGMFQDLARKTAGNRFVKFEAGQKPRTRPKPRFFRRDLLRELVCDECGRDYGVYAIALYCPDCGAPNIHLHFAREVALVRAQVELAGKLEADESELAYRLLGNAHEDVLTAFEAALKTVYLHKTRGPAGDADAKPPGNAFQNIERARKRFEAVQYDPFGCLEPAALAVLALNIQKRHIIGHNLGVADAAFAEHATDARIGETVPLVGDEILQFARIAQIVVNHLDAWLANGVAPPSQADSPAAERIADVSPNPKPLTIGELGPLATRIGLWIAEESETGFDAFVPEDALRKAFPDADDDALALAVAELAKDGYLSTTATISRRIPRIFTTVELFLEFDPHALKSDPTADAVAIADLVLADAKPRTIDVEALFKATGWTLRRFNPAFACVVAQINEERVLHGGSDTYPARGFALLDEDRVDLKRFADRLRR